MRFYLLRVIILCVIITGHLSYLNAQNIGDSYEIFQGSINRKMDDYINRVHPADPKDSSNDYHKSLFPICQNGKYGYVNSVGDIIVPCEYDSVSDFDQGDLALYAAEKSGVYTLFYSDGVAAISGLTGYIPVDVKDMVIDGSRARADYMVIVRWPDIGWTFTNTVFGWMPKDFSFDDYEMEEVTYEKNVYSSSESHYFSHYIILKRKKDLKCGVIHPASGDHIIPFVYDNIHFVDGDKSRVVVYKGNSSEILNLEKL